MTEVIADMICALTAVAKETNLSKETLIECMITAYDGNED